MTNENTNISDIMSDDDMLKIVDDTVVEFNPGDVVKGKITNVTDDEVYLDLNYKCDGLITFREFTINQHAKLRDIAKVGDEVEVVVLDKEDKNFRLIVSKRRAEYEQVWQKLQVIKDADETVRGTVIDAVKGGLKVDVGIGAFLPNSLIDVRKTVDSKVFIGEEIEAKIIEIDKAKKNIVLSRKAIIEDVDAEAKKELLKNLTVGSRQKGYVSSIVPFGAFINIGGVDGLVHISELSWSRVDNPHDVIKIGEEVEVEVISIEDGRFSLSIKATEPNPWDNFTQKYSIGQIVPATITKFSEYGGVFAEIEKNIEGLIHISEVSTRRIDTPKGIYNIGDVIYARIIDINLDRHQLALSIRQADIDFDPNSDDFDPAVYGLHVEYDADGNYKYPDGFDSETNDWKPGFEDAKKAWETEYKKAYETWTKHKVSFKEKAKLFEDIPEAVAPKKESSKRIVKSALSEDEDLLQLKEQLAGGTKSEKDEKPAKEEKADKPAKTSDKEDKEEK